MIYRVFLGQRTDMRPEVHPSTLRCCHCYSVHLEKRFTPLDTTQLLLHACSFERIAGLARAPQLTILCYSFLETFYFFHASKNRLRRVETIFMEVEINPSSANLI